MKIGELSTRTGVATRLLRYYEEQQLLAPERSVNGYRDYPEEAVAQVEQIRALIRSGLTTQFVRILLDMQSVQGSELAAECSRTVALMIAQELAAIDERLACLSRSRETMRDWLARTDHQVLA